MLSAACIAFAACFSMHRVAGTDKERSASIHVAAHIIVPALLGLIRHSWPPLAEHLTAAVVVMQLTLNTLPTLLLPRHRSMHPHGASTPGPTRKLLPARYQVHGTS